MSGELWLCQVSAVVVATAVTVRDEMDGQGPHLQQVFK